MHPSIPTGVANAASMLQNLRQAVGGPLSQEESNPFAGFMLGSGLNPETPAPACNPFAGSLGYH